MVGCIVRATGVFGVYQSSQSFNDKPFGYQEAKARWHTIDWWDMSP
jgi:hypothetical protein